MASFWIHEFKQGKMTGSATGGYETLAEACEKIDQKRDSRDHSPQYIAFKEGGYDWHVVEFDGDAGDYEILY